MKQVSKFLFKNSINITSAVLTFYLLYEDFQLFFSKPTYTSNSESKLQPKNFPSIILCPFPTFNQAELLKIGYEDGYDYAKGKIEGSNLNSWIGNSSSLVENIIDKVAILKSEKDCPGLFIIYDEDQYSHAYESIQYEMTPMAYPNGRCCKAKISAKAKKKILMKIWMKVKNTDNSSTIKGFQMYFVSQELYNILKLNTNGITMTADSRIKGYAKFEASAQNIINLEDDPKIKCKNYMKPNGYDEVIFTFSNIAP